MQRLRSTIIGVLMLTIGITIGSTAKPTAPAAQAQAGCRTFTETHKIVCGRFLDYWNAHGALAQQGLPLTGEFTEVSDTNGQAYIVQYFERAVFEKHPENPAPYDVLLSQLGTFRFQQKYSGVDPSGSAQPPQPQPPTGGKIHELGDEFEFSPGHYIKWQDWNASKCIGGTNVTVYWGLEVRNPTDKPFDYQVYPNDLHVRDSTGNNWPIVEPKAAQLQIIQRGAQSRLFVQSNCVQIFQGTTYIDLVVDKISNLGGPFIFRRHLANAQP